MTIQDAAMKGRPIARALNVSRAEAKRQIVANHEEEYDALVIRLMADKGFEQTTQTVVKTVWSSNGVS